MSFDDSVRSRQDIRRDRQADLLGSVEIDYQLKFHRLLHGKIGRLGPFQDFVDEGGRTPKHVVIARSMRHEPPGFWVFTLTKHCRQTVFCRAFYDLLVVSLRDDGLQYHEGISFPARS